MNKFRQLLAVSSISLAFAVPLTASAEEETSQDKTTKENTCFWIDSIRDFRAIDNKHVYLRGAGKEQKFLATLFQRCYGVRWAETIALQSRPTSRICSRGNEYLHVFDQPGTTFPQRCLIDDIERVESLDAARALVEERKKDKDSEEEKDVSELQSETHSSLQ